MTDAVSGPQTTEIENTKKKVLARTEGLPSLSTIVNEFLELSKSELFTAKDFERVISKDQALVGRLLKTANSSAYGRPRSIHSVSDAVVLIGLDELKKIVYAVSSEGLLRRDFKVYSYPDKGFWKHSMGVALLSRALVEGSKNTFLKGEQYFVAGLVHDVGKLIIDDFLDTASGQRNVGITEEKTAAGMDHAELGDYILKNWCIPDDIAGAVRHHHDPTAAGRSLRGALVVAAADSICNLWGVGNRLYMDLGEDVDPAHHQEVLRELKISDTRLGEILWDTRQKLANLEEIFEAED